jgi:hypothetical protein
MDYICIINHSILILSKINVTKKKQFLSLKKNFNIESLNEIDRPAKTI